MRSKGRFLSRIHKCDLSKELMNLPMKNTAPGPKAELIVTNSKLKLREQVREVMRPRHYFVRTEEAYRGWIRQFIVRAGDHTHFTPTRPLSPTGRIGCLLNATVLAASMQWRESRNTQRGFGAFRGFHRVVTA